MIKRMILTTAALVGAIGLTLPAQAQSTQAGDLQISAQDQQQNANNPYSERQLSGLANQINETADPGIDSNTVDVYPLPQVEGFPDNLVLIESGLDTFTPEDTLGNYAIGVSF